MDKTNEKLLIRITELVASMGWSIALPHLADDEDVKGMIIGTPEYIDEVLSGDYSELDESNYDA